MEELILGVDYYPEHDPESEWPLDVALMRELGLNAIRIGEFAWSRMQRPDGTFTLDWIDRCVNLFGEHGIDTILCTPTATPPVWIAERFPDLPVVLPDGRRGEFGGRRHYSVFHEGYRQLAAAIAEALANRFGDNPHVIGWHIDNEIGSYSGIDCSEPARQAFHRHVAEKYGTVENVNRRWGLIFWNQEIERFDQLPAPTEMMCTRSPQYLLEYNRFCARGMAEFALLQAEAIRRHKGAHQWVVASCQENVNYALFDEHRRRGGGLLDYVEHNNYPESVGSPGHSAMQLDRLRAVDRPRAFLTLEQQMGTGRTTSGGLDDRVRRYWAWDALARGSRSVAWFHWRRFRTGCEWRHPCVLERDRVPRSAFRNLQQFIREVRRVQPILLESTVAADVQVFLDPDSIRARDRASEPVFWMEIQLPDAWAHRFPLWEKEVRRTVYQPLTGCGLTLDFVQPHETWDTGKPLIIPDLDLYTEPLVDKLTRFCHDGGTVICFPGVGERDEFGAHLDAPSPGRLAPLFGVRLADPFPLLPAAVTAYDLARELTGDGAPVNAEARGSVRIGNRSVAVDVRHAEILEVIDAKTIGRYESGGSDGKPAMTERTVGRGRAVYLGAVPADAEAATRLYRALLPHLVTRRIPYVRVKLQAGREHYEFLLNNSASACPLTAPVRDLISDRPIAELPPYGVVLAKVTEKTRRRQPRTGRRR